MKTIHVVPHTHWDREWYFTTQDTLVLSDHLFTEVIEELEKDKTAKFCLDGQSSIIEDYLNIRPQNEKRIKELVAEGRLSIGPWYTQTDCQYVDGESIIRNLSYGIFQSKKWGNYMKVAYLPDSFGFNAQMPTITKHCNIDNLIFRRGSDFDVNLKDSYFKWKGLSGKSVDTVHLLEGYGMAHGLNVGEAFRDERMFPYIKNVQKYTSADNLVICAGGDQTNINKDMTLKLEEINKFTEDNYVQSTYDEFFDSVKSYFASEYVGELREGRYDRVHRTIGGIRYDIKYTNYIVEKKLINRVEPLMAIAKSHGLEIGVGLLYKAWKLIMEGQAHDGMGGCITDNVAKQVIDRIEMADEIADAIENLVKNKIAEMLMLDQNQVILFNTDINEFTGIKDIMFMAPNQNVTIEGCEFVIDKFIQFEGKTDLLIENPEGHIYVNEDPYVQVFGKVQCTIPAMGYKVFEIIEADAIMVEESQSKTITNDHYTISCEDKLVLKSGDITIEDFLSFEDIGNDGDTYDYSPLKGDSVIEFSPTFVKTETSKLINKMYLKACVQLPKDLDSRLNSTNLVDFVIDLVITLNDTNIIDVKMSCDNNVLSHRLRVAIKTNIATTQSISSLPFGFIKRDILNGKIIDWTGYNEIPIDINPTDELCALSQDYTVYVPTRGLKEFQAIDDKLYLTLLATTSQLGKPNLEYRPGRASGDTTKKGHIMISTPSAEQLGHNEFRFAIVVDPKSFCDKIASNIINKYLDREVHYQKQALNKFVNRLDNKIAARPEIGKYQFSEFSLLDIKTDLTISSLSPSLYDDKYLLRLKNQTSQPIELGNLNIHEFTIVNAIEEVQPNITTVDAFDFITIKFAIDKVDNA